MTRGKRGQFVRREGRITWHLVESWVADDAVTYCGRRMGDEATDDGGLVTTDPDVVRPNLSPMCKTCQRKDVDGAKTRVG